MPTFREVNTGQFVNVNESDAGWFHAQARWEAVDGESETPKVAAPVAEEKADAAPVAETSTKPADDAPRDEWVAYALANGKTEADLKGTRITTIRGWFDNK